METRKYILTVECKDEEHADDNFNDLEEYLDSLCDEHKVIESYKINRVEVDTDYSVYEAVIKCNSSQEDIQHYGQCVDPKCSFYNSEQEAVSAMRIGMMLNSNIQ